MLKPNKWLHARDAQHHQYAGEQGAKVIFVCQSELSTTASHAKLLFAIYSYFAEAEREYISTRTKQGLAATKAQGIQLGRRKGSRNKHRPLDPFREHIKELLGAGLPITSIQKLINPQLEQPLTYNSYRYFIHADEELAGILKW